MDRVEPEPAALVWRLARRGGTGEAGLPGEMLSVVTGDPAEIADELITNPAVDLVTFTGGVPIGKYIAAKAGYRRMVLELGGNDPFIVMEDADIDEASTLAVTGSYKNSGQRCTAVKRMLVHEAVADRFVEQVVAKTRAWTYGDPGDKAMDMGTVIDEAALVAALQSRTIAAAGLDVFEHEPQVPAALMALDNAVLMPHRGGGTIETWEECADMVIANLHTLDTARRYCDRVIGMRDGRIVFDGTPDQLSTGVAREIYGADDTFNEAATSTSIPTDTNPDRTYADLMLS
jgi:hypothetical protein